MLLLFGGLLLAFSTRAPPSRAALRHQPLAACAEAQPTEQNFQLQPLAPVGETLRQLDPSSVGVVSLDLEQCAGARVLPDVATLPK